MPLTPEQQERRNKIRAGLSKLIRDEIAADRAEREAAAAAEAPTDGGPDGGNGAVANKRPSPAPKRRNTDSGASQAPQGSPAEGSRISRGRSLFYGRFRQPS